MANQGHQGRQWRTIRATIRAENAPCWLCGQPIDNTLKHPNPMSFTVDYVTPWSQGGTMTRNNLRPTHASCNKSRGARTPRTVNTRDW